MRKREKEKILSLLGSMEEAHKEILLFLQEEKSEEASSLLSICQEGMEKCGKEVELQEERGEEYSSFFFSYLEKIFHCYEAVQEDNWERSREIFAEVILLHKDIVRTVQSLAEQSLILFLPYKASMWDSMESVYLAAREDPNCIPLVMPISYIQRNSGNEEMLLLNEREDFPKDIPLIGEDFSFETERPDCIFIHNPYDDKNYVTSVHQRYYTANLKQFTNCLVYIPYFTSMGILTNDPGSLIDFLHIDYIVAQNELHRKSFPKSAQEKCILLGSPKFDRVLQLNKKNYEIPQEWEEIAEGRRVIFFNTSITLMLENTEVFLNKLEEVLTLFQAHEKYCLLWRPHPLLENSLRTIRADFLERFLALKEAYILGKWGIFDDSAQMERAMFYADMYLGDDGSSMVNLFAAAKKEIFILDNHLLDRERNPEYRVIKTVIDELDGNCAAVFEGRFLLEGRREGNIFSIQKQELKDYLGGEELAGDGYTKAFPEVEKSGKKWILPPISGNRIFCLEKGSLPKTVPLKTIAYRPNAFSEWKRMGNKLYGKPAFYENLVSFFGNRLAEGGNDFSILLRSVTAGQIHRGGILYSAPFLLFPLKSDKGLFFVEENNFEEIFFPMPGEEGSGFSDLAFAKEERTVWALPVSGTILYKISFAKGTWKKYDLALEAAEIISEEEKMPAESNVKEESEAPGYDAFHGRSTENYLYSSVYETKEMLWIAPQNAKDLLYMDKKTGYVKHISLPSDGITEPFVKSDTGNITMEERGEINNLWKKRSGGKFFSHQGENYYYDNRNNRLYLMRENQMLPLNIQFEFALEELSSGFLPWERSLYSIRESDFYTVKDFAEGKAVSLPFSQEKLEKQLQTVSYNMDGTAGEKIYQFFAKECRKGNR